MANHDAIRLHLLTLCAKGREDRFESEFLPLLRRAILQGVQLDALVDDRRVHKRSMLHHAVVNNRLDIVKVLVGPMRNVLTDEEHKKRKLENSNIDDLDERVFEDILILNSRNQNVVDSAATRNHGECFEMILNSCKDWKEKKKLLMNENCSSLGWCASSNPSLFKSIVRTTVDDDGKRVLDVDFFIANIDIVHHALWERTGESMRFILDDVCGRDNKDQRGELMRALIEKCGSKIVVDAASAVHPIIFTPEFEPLGYDREKMLFSRDKGGPPLLFSCIIYGTAHYRLLVSICGDDDDKKRQLFNMVDSKQRTILHLAVRFCFSCKDEVLEEILREDGDLIRVMGCEYVLRRDVDGKTCLHSPLRPAHLKGIFVLLRILSSYPPNRWIYSAILNMKDNSGMTPLQCLASGRISKEEEDRKIYCRRELSSIKAAILLYQIDDEDFLDHLNKYERGWRIGHPLETVNKFPPRMEIDPNIGCGGM